MPEQTSQRPQIVKCSHCGQEIDDVAAYRACPGCSRSFFNISSSLPDNLTASSVQETSRSAEIVQIGRGSPASIFSLILYMAAIAIAAVGLAIAYTDPDYQHKIVGGDALNYIIFAARGAVWVGASIVTAIAALGLQIVGHVAKLRHPSYD